MSIKHSKFKNTYLIYEFLVRQTLTDVLGDKDLKESQAFNIIKNNFSKGILKEELMLYQSLVNSNINNKNTADYLIQECIDRYKRLPKNELRQKKYSLIGEIKDHYDINKLFSTQIPEYPEAGAVYMMFESEDKDNVMKKAKYMGVISENIMTPNKEDKSKKMFECIKEASNDERELAYKILVNTFNKKFTNALNENQKSYMKDFIYSNTNESGWIQEHIENIRKDIKDSKKHLNKDNDDKVLNMKLNECVKKLDSISEKKIFKDEDHRKMLTMYKLTNLLEEYA